MSPSAQLQAAIEIVDAVIGAARTAGPAADTLIARYFRERRYAGARDRRAVRELVYAAIRRAGEMPRTGREALVGLAGDQPELIDRFDGSTYGPEPLRPSEPAAIAGVAPEWLASRLAHGGLMANGELPALLARAPLDLRANRLKTSRGELLASLAGAQPGRLSADAFRLPEGTNVEQLPEWQSGLFEVQDEGSQLVVRACDARPGQIVVDLCAGAGGKTLGLAADMGQGTGAAGRLIACDVDRSRLARLAPRAERAGAVVEMRLLDGAREKEALADLRDTADVVLVDAPCSGSGTWRRNPEGRWRLTPARLDRLLATQAHVLDLARALVRPGGELVYAVCSLLMEEGGAQVDRFLGEHPGWRPRALPFGRSCGPGRLLTPASDGTDGFFVACLTRQ